MPPPYAAWAPDAITVGSASKSFWGGLRLGWIRCPEGRMEQLLSARVALDLGTPVLEQLVMARLLEEPGAIVEHHRSRLRAQRDALAAALAEHLPQWEFRLPTGGLAVWCRLPVTQATAVAAEAERLGVVVSPGPVFAVDGGLDRFVRIPWTRPAEDLEEAVRRLAEAWERVRGRSTGRARLRGRVMVA
jgi:DNA-binding transcriptional MocR family regulator